MKKLVLLLSACSLFLGLVSCGPNSTLGESDKKTLRQQGDKPLFQINDPAAKKSVEDIFYKLLSETDYLALANDSNHLIAVAQPFQQCKSSKQEQAKAENQKKIKTNAEKISLFIKGNKAKVLAELKDINPNNYAQCFDMTSQLIEKTKGFDCGVSKDSREKAAKDAFNSDEAKARSCGDLFAETLGKIKTLAGAGHL